MVREALSPSASTAWELDAGWLDVAADRGVAAIEERRSTWQIWHVRAEAQRYIRAADMPTTQANRLLDLLVGEVLNSRSISLARPDTVVEPKALGCSSRSRPPGRAKQPRCGLSPPRGGTAAEPSSGLSHCEYKASHVWAIRCAQGAIHLAVCPHDHFPPPADRFHRYLSPRQWRGDLSRSLALVGGLPRIPMSTQLVPGIYERLQKRGRVRQRWIRAVDLRPASGSQP